MINIGFFMNEELFCTKTWTTQRGYVGEEKKVLNCKKIIKFMKRVKVKALGAASEKPKKIRK
jgi:hypothetical protein